MGARLTFGTAGATGGGWASQPGTLQPAYEELTAEPRWSWQARSPKTWRDPNNWYSRWSYGCRVSYGDVGGGDGASWYDMSHGDNYEPFSCDGPGQQSLKFLRGTCKDSVGTPVANAIVQAFRTSDDAFAGYEVTANNDGTYVLATNFPGVNHYAVAYKAGSPDIAGTTVNTLVPTNVDGT